MADVLFGIARASTESPSLLDQYDAPSTVASANEDVFPCKRQGLSLADELAKLQLRGILDDSEDEASLFTPAFSDHQSRCYSQNDVDPAPSSHISDHSIDEHLRRLLSFPFFYKDSVRYYNDMRSLYPVDQHESIYRNQHQLFTNFHSLWDASLPMKSLRSLEVGCGAGHWAKAFAISYPQTTVLGVDSTCFGPRLDSDPLNYQFVKIDDISAPASFNSVIGTTDPSPIDQHIRGPFDYIRITRMNGRVRRWSELCEKMYSYAKNGAQIEVYDVLPEHITKTGAHQPTWAMVPQWYNDCFRMKLVPHLPPRDRAGCSQVAEHLETAGFTVIKTTERTSNLRMKPCGDSASRHIDALIEEAIGIAHLAGVTHKNLGFFRCLLREEALQFGLAVRSFTVCAEKP